MSIANPSIWAVRNGEYKVGKQQPSFRNLKTIWEVGRVSSSITSKPHLVTQLQRAGLCCQQTWTSAQAEVSMD